MRAIPCIHGKPAIRHCVECRRAAVNKSSRKRYNPEYTRQWYATNRIKQRVAVTNIRAKKLNAPGEVTEEFMVKLLSKPCVYCGSQKNIELDHRIPLSRGGTNESSNIQPVCRFCNRSKHWYGEDEFLEWLNSLRQAS